MFPAMYIPELVHTPFSNVLGQRNYLQGSRCEDFEFRFARCLDAYGVQAYENQCKDYYADLVECVYGPKQNQRCKQMYKELQQQRRNGKAPDYTDEIPEKYVKSF